MDTEPEPTQAHVSADSASAQEPVAQAAVHLVGLADGTPTEGQDAELQDALAAETKNKVAYTYFCILPGNVNLSHMFCL